MPKQPPVNLPDLVGAQFNFWSKAEERDFQEITGINPKGPFTVVAAQYHPAYMNSVGGIGFKEECWTMTIQNEQGDTVSVTDYSGGPFCPLL